MLIEYMPLDLTADELKDFAKVYGYVRSVQIWKERHWKNGIIVYVHQEAFAIALTRLNYRRVEGWEMNLKCTRIPLPPRPKELSKWQSHRHPHVHMLIKYMPQDMTADELEEHAKAYGHVRSARVWKEKHWTTGIIE